MRRNGNVILLTGATGFLGSHLMVSLLKEGFHLLILGRSSGKLSLNDRIRQILRWFNEEERIFQLETFEADLLCAFAGLSPGDYDYICENTRQVIHCASDTRFPECFRKDIIKSNIECLNEILNICHGSRVSYLHYISTAYAAGLHQEHCREELSNASKFANVYEESKSVAEKKITAECRAYKIPYTIIRPSVVYGDSETGKSNSFNALYFQVKSLYYLKEIYLNDIYKNKGRKASACGIYLTDQGKLHMPLNVFIPNDGKINLVPVNYFTQAVLSVMKNPSQGEIYHITSPKPEKFSELAAWCEKFLDLEGLNVVFSDVPKNYTFTPAESLFNRFVEQYLPYFSDLRIFENKKLKEIFPADPPELTYEIFERCMSYALGTGWGARLYSPLIRVEETSDVL